jgi:hypothetical protein
MKSFDQVSSIHNSRILLHLASFVLIAICVLPTRQVKADALADLRTTLQGLNANTPIKGTLEVQSVKVDPKKDKNNKPAAPAQLQLEIDAGEGLGIQLSPTLLQQINTEQQANTKDPEQPTPATDLLRATDPMEVERLVSTAPWLLQALAGATSSITKSTELAGVPAQELSMDVPLKAPKKDSSNISDYKGSMSVWLDAKGIPLAYRQSFHAKFCKFFLCLSVDETRDGKLLEVGGRLVTVSFIDESKQSGLGQDGNTKKTYILNLNGGSQDQTLK